MQLTTTDTDTCKDDIPHVLTWEDDMSPPTAPPPPYT